MTQRAVRILRCKTPTYQRPFLRVRKRSVRESSFDTPQTNPHELDSDETDRGERMHMTLRDQGESAVRPGRRISPLEPPEASHATAGLRPHVLQNASNLVQRHCRDKAQVTKQGLPVNTGLCQHCGALQKRAVARFAKQVEDSPVLHQHARPKAHKRGHIEVLPMAETSLP